MRFFCSIKISEDFYNGLIASGFDFSAKISSFLLALDNNSCLDTDSLMLELFNIWSQCPYFLWHGQIFDFFEVSQLFSLWKFHSLATYPEDKGGTQQKFYHL